MLSVMLRPRLAALSICPTLCAHSSTLICLFHTQRLVYVNHSVCTVPVFARLCNQRVVAFLNVAMCYHDVPCSCSLMCRSSLCVSACTNTAVCVSVMYAIRGRITSVRSATRHETKQEKVRPTMSSYSFGNKIKEIKEPPQHMQGGLGYSGF